MDPKAELQKLIEGIKTKQFRDGEAKGLVETIGSEITKQLKPAFEALATSLKGEMSTAFKDAVNSIKVDVPSQEMPDIPAPVVNVPAPVVHVPAPVVNVPAPVVNVPETKFPDPVPFPDSFRIAGIDPKHPLHVMSVDEAGKRVRPVDNGGAGGGRGDFFTIAGFNSSIGAALIDSSGAQYSSSNPFPVTVTSGGSATTGSALVDSTGVQYSGSNPFPTTAVITLPAGQGDSATATRVVIAGDSSSSVSTQTQGRNETDAGTLRVTIMTDTAQSTNILSFNGNPPATGLNETTVGVLRTVQMSDTVSSVYANNPFGQGDSATALRVVQAGDVASSVSVTSITGPIGQGDAASALRVVQAGNAASSVMTAATGLNETTVDVIRAVLMSDTISSMNVVTFNGNPPATGLNETTTGVLRVAQMTDVVSSAYLQNPFGPGAGATALRVLLAGDVASSVSVIDFAGNVPALGLNETTNGVLRTVTMSDTASSSQSKLVAMTTLPTAAADAASTFQKSDKLGREVNRPVNVRDLIATAYVTLSTGTEATLLAAAAGQYIDLISIIAANTSTAAVQLDIRCVTAGNIVQSLYIPGNATSGWTPPVPWPQDATGNTWTVDMPDITNSNILISALFSKEV